MHEGLAPGCGLDHKRGVSDTSEHRTGFVALSGKPNAGKSTLLNAILGQQISIVSPKPQTTRNRIIGVHNLEGAQVILVDTPGLSDGRDELGRRMLRGAQEAMGDADVVVRVVDASRLRLDHDGDLDLEPARRPTVVALNKVDLVRPKDRLLPQIERLAGVEGIEAVVPISALRRDRVEAVLSEVTARLPQGPPLYPPEMITDRPERFLASELVREAVLKLTRQEVPHATAVAVTGWREVKGECHIEAAIYVERSSQKAIMIGKGGEMIKRIGTSARQQIIDLLDCMVHLKLRVDVSSQWRADPAALAMLGYDE